LTSKKPDLKKLKEFESNTSFDELWFADTKGNLYIDRKTKEDIYDVDFFVNGLHGGAGVTYFGAERAGMENKVGFYAPVYYKNEIVGILLGTINKNRVADMLEYDLFEVQGEGWLCDADGTVIGSNRDIEYTNFLEYLEKSGGCTREELSHIAHVFGYGQGASFAFRRNGEEVRCCAASIPYAGWILVRTFPPEAYRAMLLRTNRNSFFVILILTAVFAVYITVMYISFSKEKKYLDKQRNDAEDIALGMASLFGNCLTVDLAAKEYNYVIGDPDDESIPASGEYLLYYESILTRITDVENRRHAAEFFKIDNLKKSLAVLDSVSMRLHLAREGVDDWEIFTFIVLARKGTEPNRLLLVSHSASESFYS
jgi:hypothetical protein